MRRIIATHLFFYYFCPLYYNIKIMKKTLIVILAVLQAITLFAQSKNPKWVDNAFKSVFNIEATDKNGTTKNGYGFFISDNGEAVASYDLFRGAEKAVAILSSGERLLITQVLGADDMYGVIRFKVAVPKKTAFLKIAQDSPTANTVAYLPPASVGKSTTQGVITEITKIKNTYDYYKIGLDLPASQVSYPLLNGAGDVFAMAQSDASGKGNTYGISISYIQSLLSTATDMLKKTYSDIGIRKAWSQDFEEAQISLFLYASQQDARTYLETLNDFISVFPNRAEGYYSRATHYVYNREELASSENEQIQMLDNAWNDLESADKLSKNKDEVFYNKAKLIFGVISNDSTFQYKNWNIEFVEENILKAIAVNDLPVYRNLEADLAFNSGNYEKAFELYSIVNNSEAASGQSFYLAAKCKQQLGGYNYLEVITLLDSAVAKSPVNEAAVYLLENVELKMLAGQYEQAVKDYDLYYLMSGGNVYDDFFYYREQAKYRAGDFEGALKDIEMSILINNTNAIYYAEKASVYLRLQDLPKAQESAEKAIETDPEFASAYRILGVSLVRQDKKTDACVQLNKAKDLGDPVAERLIKENCQ